MPRGAAQAFPVSLGIATSWWLCPTANLVSAWPHAFPRMSTAEQSRRWTRGSILVSRQLQQPPALPPHHNLRRQRLRPFAPASALPLGLQHRQRPLGGPLAGGGPAVVDGGGDVRVKAGFGNLDGGLDDGQGGGHWAAPPAASSCPAVQQSGQTTWP